MREIFFEIIGNSGDLFHDQTGKDLDSRIRKVWNRKINHRFYTSFQGSFFRRITINESHKTRIYYNRTSPLNDHVINIRVYVTGMGGYTSLLSSATNDV